MILVRFLRHWNRGDYNSCTRTDLTFKPVPDSKLARKREERLRKQAEREREERERAQQAQAARKITTPEKPDVKPPSRGPLETISSPYERFQRPGFNDTPALRTLSEYARPHAGMSPGHMPRSLLPPAHCMDTMIQYQLSSMYGPGVRERIELEHLEREKRDREIRELREREMNDRIKEEIMKSGMRVPPNPMDPHWLEIQRRYAAAGLAGPAGSTSNNHNELIRERTRINSTVFFSFVVLPFRTWFTDTSLCLISRQSDYGSIVAIGTGTFREIRYTATSWSTGTTWRTTRTPTSSARAIRGG